VVDDEKDTAETACQLLRLWGNESWAACDGATAVEAARVGAPNVVLLDIGLPDLDGLEVARRMRAQAAAHPPLLVAVTGYGSAADRERTAQAGFDLHLVKPVEPDCLRDLLVTYRRTLRAEQAPAAPPTGAAPAVTASGRESVPADGAHPVLTALESEIQRRLGSRVRGLRILVRSGMAVLRGRACSYYVKQLAQHAVMELSALTIHANEIEVE
jgi:CheY-like chemotaxis protein